jgi:hypothetical protein
VHVDDLAGRRHHGSHKVPVPDVVAAAAGHGQWTAAARSGGAVRRHRAHKGPKYDADAPGCCWVAASRPPQPASSSTSTPASAPAVGIGTNSCIVSATAHKGMPTNCSTEFLNHVEELSLMYMVMEDFIFDPGITVDVFSIIALNYVNVGLPSSCETKGPSVILDVVDWLRTTAMNVNMCSALSLVCTNSGGHQFRRLPNRIVLGHEAAGIAESVSDGVAEVQLGVNCVSEWTVDIFAVKCFCWTSWECKKQGLGMFDKLVQCLQLRLLLLQQLGDGFLTSCIVVSCHLQRPEWCKPVAAGMIAMDLRHVISLVATAVVMTGNADGVVARIMAAMPCETAERQV